MSNWFFDWARSPISVNTPSKVIYSDPFFTAKKCSFHLLGQETGPGYEKNQQLLHPMQSTSTIKNDTWHVHLDFLNTPKHNQYLNPKKPPFPTAHPWWVMMIVRSHLSSMSFWKEVVNLKGSRNGVQCIWYMYIYLQIYTVLDITGKYTVI